MISRCEPVQFFASITKSPEDKFAHTFVAKANAMHLWELMRGLPAEGNTLKGAIVVRVSQRSPRVANLQLLHTFAKYRRQGVGRLLVNDAFQRIQTEAEYFRVSSEPEAVPFYESLGFKFLGKQKSGCLVSMFKMNGPKISEGFYNLEDPVIKKALFSKQRGSIVELL